MFRKTVITGIIAIFLILVYYTVYGFEENPTPATVYNYPSPDEMKNGLPDYKSRRLALNARSALVIDNSTGHWIYAKRPQKLRPIASLTKLLTAMVYLDSDPNLDTIVYISARDCYESAKSHIYKGEAYKAIDLLYAALMSSDNRAARAIATASGIARLNFIEKMNEKAKSLGMMNTEVFEVTGLDDRNISTAADIALLVRESMKYYHIKEATSKYKRKVKVQNKKRIKNFVNTNRLVLSRYDILAGKTGFIIESDYCLGTIMRDKQGRELTLVVLGSPTNSIRFQVADKLARYCFKRVGRLENGEIAGR